MKPGKVLWIFFKGFIRLAILLKHEGKSNQMLVFVLLNELEKNLYENKNPASNDHHDNNDTDEQRWNRILSISKGYFMPDGLGYHDIILVSYKDVVEFTHKTVKICSEEVIKDFNQRKIPRFSCFKPSLGVLQLVSELNFLTSELVGDKQNKSLVDTIEAFLLTQDLEIINIVHKLKSKALYLENFKNCCEIPTFESELRKIHDKRILQNQIKIQEYRLSKQSLSLYPDYLNKLKVLNQLKYVDDLDQVTMKGRVACEISQNELIITELVLRNVLTDMQPAEIAALLSSLVFQEKTENEHLSESVLSPALAKVSPTKISKGL